MVKRHAIVAVAALLALACSGSRTEILIEVDTDIPYPDDIDAFVIAAQSPEGRVQRARAELVRGGPTPRTLGMVHQSGELGPYAVTVTGELGGVEVVRRSAQVTFVRGQTLVWRVSLLDSCIGVECGAGESCAAGGCRSIAVGQGELETWDGTPPFQDAGPIDACIPDERCNGIDDDCDDATDEGFDLDNDVENCGACRNACEGMNARWSCVAGVCVIDACEAGFDDCNGSAGDGCEVNLTSDPSNCGGCTTVCAPPDRDCCSGTCGRC